MTAHGGYACWEGHDGKTLYYTKFNQDGIWQLRPNQQEVQLVEDLKPGDWGNWHLGPDHVYYLRRTGQPPDLLVAKPLNGGDAEKWPLPLSVPTNDANLAVSPDGRWLLFCAQSYGGSDLLMTTYGR